MTTFEHSLVGVHFAFASGLHRFIVWRSVALAGFASVLPDWDGIPMLFDMQRFEKGHRVWGHNVLSITLISLLIGYAQSRWDWLGRLAARVHRMTSKESSASIGAGQRTSWTSGAAGLWCYSLVSMVAQLLHLPCDMVVSGGQGLSDWEVQPWWPFSEASYVYPMIPWGDVGPTVILMAGVIAIAKFKSGISKLSWLTIGILCCYLLVRSLM